MGGNMSKSINKQNGENIYATVSASSIQNGNNFSRLNNQVLDNSLKISKNENLINKWLAEAKESRNRTLSSVNSKKIKDIYKTLNEFIDLHGDNFKEANDTDSVNNDNFKEHKYNTQTFINQKNKFYGTWKLTNNKKIKINNDEIKFIDNNNNEIYEKALFNNKTNETLHEYNNNKVRVESKWEKTIILSEINNNDINDDINNFIIIHTNVNIYSHLTKTRTTIEIPTLITYIQLLNNKDSNPNPVLKVVHRQHKDINYNTIFDEFKKMLDGDGDLYTLEKNTKN